MKTVAKIQIDATQSRSMASLIVFWANKFILMIAIDIGLSTVRNESRCRTAQTQAIVPDYTNWPQAPVILVAAASRSVATASRVALLDLTVPFGSSNSAALDASFSCMTAVCKNDVAALLRALLILDVRSFTIPVRLEASLIQFSMVSFSPDSQVVTLSACLVESLSPFTVAERSSRTATIGRFGSYSPGGIWLPGAGACLPDCSEAFSVDPAGLDLADVLDLPSVLGFLVVVVFLSLAFAAPVLESGERAFGEDDFFFGVETSVFGFGFFCESAGLIFFVDRETSFGLPEAAVRALFVPTSVFVVGLPTEFGDLDLTDGFC